MSTLIAMTVRLESAVARALSETALLEGREVADYAADVLAQHVMPKLQKNDPEAAKRVQAELELKSAAVKFAVDETRRAGFDPHITLKTFQWIRNDDELRRLYLRAIGDRPGDERGNPIKARINRNLGATIKTAVGAVPQTANGNPLKAQVTGEFIRSYTPLSPGPANGA